jgi:hypothetical protein
MFAVYSFMITLCWPFGEHVSKKNVVDIVMVTSYNVASRIIYEWAIAHVQSGGLDLKSYNTLPLNMFGAIRMVYIYEIIGTD